MRVLLLRRHSTGSAAAYVDLLAPALAEHGVEAEVFDAAAWIPRERGWKIDRVVSKRLRVESQGFDVIHAIGYRCAWACSAAFYLRRPWTYAAFDMPRTTESALVDRLASARAGICSCKAVKNALEDGHTTDLHLVAPGVAVDGVETAFTATPPTLAFEGEPPPEVLKAVRNEFADVHVASGEEPATLFVSLHGRAGFSVPVAEAMARGVPPLVLRKGGLGEMVLAGHSGYVVPEVDRVAATICELLTNSGGLPAAGLAARARVSERFDIRRSASQTASLFKGLLR